MPGFNIGGNGSGPSNLIRLHREHRWEIMDLGIPAGVSGVAQPGGRSGTIARSPSQHTRNATKFYAKTLQLPSLSFENEEVKGAGHKYKFAREADWDDVTVTFYDTFGLYQQFKTWQDLIWTPENGIGLADIYKGHPSFALIDEQGKRIQRYNLKGAYPRKISHGDLSYTSSEVKLLSVTFSYDWAEIVLEDNDTGPSSGPSASDVPSPITVSQNSPLITT